MTFAESYQKLNPKQREAVDTIYGPVLVIAGPGSGKTQLLSARIANILSTTDYLPSNILSLTFTESAARNMRERLASMIGPDAYRVAIHTFHSFGNEILGRYKYMFREYADANVIDDIIASRIIDDILTPLAWDHPYKPRGRASDTISDIRSTIDNLKKGGITPSLYRMIIEMNRRTLNALSPLLRETFEQIDPLGQSKVDKEKKIAIFEKFTNTVQQLSEKIEKPGNTDSLLTVIKQGLDEAWSTYDGDNNTKFLTAWKDSWTEKDYKGNRVWKEGTKLGKYLALADIYEAYQEALVDGGYIDFTDMIIRATELVETDPMIQANLAEQYQFILIDEYQDTNEAQMRLVRAILSVGLESPNIFAVGDDDQSIYKFQGANIKNIRDFHDTWPDTKLIILDTNYRSHSEIISLSRSTLSGSDRITNIFPDQEKQFASSRGSGGSVRRHTFSSELHELTWIADDIAQRIRDGVPPEEISVIVKKNKSLEPLAKALLSRGIPVSMTRSESIWESEIVALIVTMLKYLASLSTRRDASELLVEIVAHPAWQIPRIELWKLSRDIYHARRDDHKSWIEQMSLSDIPEIRDVANFLKELSNMSHTVRLEDLIDMITGANTISLPSDTDDGQISAQIQIDILGGDRKNYTSPLYAYFFGQLSDDNGSISSAERARHLANMKKFIDRVRAYKGSKPRLDLEDAIELLSLIEFYKIRIETSHLIGDETHAVNLTTIHKAKGLEWQHVYVPFLHKKEYKLGKVTGSNLPKNLPLEVEKDDDEDIERLVYTAFTRAEDSLTLTYSPLSLDEKSNESLPMIAIESPEWEEIIEVSMDLITQTLEEEKKDLYSLPYLGEEGDFLRDRIEKLFVMNATALQNFLDITSAGPAYFVGNNILRFPQAKNIAAAYGSAIHKALEDFFTDYNQKKTFQKSILHHAFEMSFKKEGFPEADEREWLDRGYTNIEALYTEITGRTYGELSVERDFRTDGGGVYLDDIQLTGKIDRVERLPDDTLIITDYKTGRGFDGFDGKGAQYEKIKQWKYQLQLSFYAILFELSPRYRMFHKKQYELFFVEKIADEDRFQRVTHFVQQGEIDRTKNLIRRVMYKIRNLDFPDTSHYPQTLDGIRQFEDDLLSGQI